MWNDPIVEEVRNTADQLVREAGYDLHEFCERVRERERRYGDRLVTLEPRKLSAATPRSGGVNEAFRTGR